MQTCIQYRAKNGQVIRKEGRCSVNGRPSGTFFSAAHARQRKSIELHSDALAELSFLASNLARIYPTHIIRFYGVFVTKTTTKSRRRGKCDRKK